MIPYPPLRVQPRSCQLQLPAYKWSRQRQAAKPRHATPHHTTVPVLRIHTPNDSCEHSSSTRDEPEPERAAPRPPAAPTWPPRPRKSNRARYSAIRDPQQAAVGDGVVGRDLAFGADRRTRDSYTKPSPRNKPVAALPPSFPRTHAARVALRLRGLLSPLSRRDRPPSSSASSPTARARPTWPPRSR
jgi:hypothetical protein